MINALEEKGKIRASKERAEGPGFPGNRAQGTVERRPRVEKCLAMFGTTLRPGWQEWKEGEGRRRQVGEVMGARREGPAGLKGLCLSVQDVSNCRVLCGGVR